MLWAYRLIAIDFDNTLDDGVLGEDSFNGIAFPAERVELIRKISELAKLGCLIYGITKNEREDIDYLLEKSEKFGLGRDLFWKVSASWKNKPEQLSAAVEEANLDPSMVLFLDDNIAELELMSASMPQVDLLSTQDPRNAIAAIESGHRIPRRTDPNWKTRAEDLRNRDLRVIENSTNPLEFHKNLGSRVKGRRLGPNDLTRAQEIIGKTNQFNLTLGRTDIASIHGKNGHLFADAEVSVRLGSSGIVAALVAKQSENCLEILEFCISCRVLGRQLESMMFVNMVLALGVEFDYVYMNWSRGHRNQPALEWIAEFAPHKKVESGWVRVPYVEFARLKEQIVYKLVCK